MKIINKIKEMYETYKYAIFSSAIFTFMTHIYYFTSRFGNEDDINFISFGFRALSSGRWTTGSFFSGAMQIPMVKFLLAIVILGLVTVLICDMFKVKKKKNMILIALLLSTFPCLAMSFSYLFMTEVYMIALLTAVASIYFTTQYKYGFILGSVLISLSLGNYQSYIGVASGLALIYLIKMILDGKDSKEIIKMFLKLLLMGIGGIILYFIILKCYLAFFDAQLSSYKGADSMGIPPLSEWKTLFLRTYLHFIGYFLGFSYFQSIKFYTFVKFIIVIICLIALFKRLKENHYKNWWLLLIAIILMPLAINIVDFVVYKTEIGVLNIYQFVLAYILAIIVIQYIFDTKSKWKNTLNIISTICFILIGYQNFYLTNQYYVKMEEFYEYTESFTNRLLVKMENTEGFSYDTPVMLVGEKDSEFYTRLYDVARWSNVVNYDQGLWGRFIGFEDIYYFESEQKVLDFIENRHGIKLTRVSDEEKEQIEKTEIYQNLKAWPSKESTKIINDVLVVKF